MATQIPEGFELVDSDIPEGFELVSDIPAGFELVDDSSVLDNIPVPTGPMQDVQGILEDPEQFLRNLGGAAAGAADIATGALTSIPFWLKAQADVALGGDPAKEREEMHQSIADYSPSNAISKLGLGDPRENQSYQMMMTPFEKIQEGIDTGVEALGGGDAAKLAVEGLSMLAPIPFAKTAGRAIGRGISRADPGLRALDEAPVRTPEPTPTEGTVHESVAPNGDVVRWVEEPVNPQLDFFEPTNPYNLGGHVTALEEGRATTIDALQPELGGRVEDFQSIPDQIQADIDRRVTQELGETGVQGELFTPETSMHRAYDQFGPNELPSGMTKEQFTKTIDNLSEQEGTLFERPDDIDAAYDKYLLDMEGRQGGLFDRPSQQEGFGRTMADEARARMEHEDLIRRIDTNPDVMNTRKAITRLQNDLDNFTNRKWTKKAEETQRKLDVLNKRLDTMITRISGEPQTPVTSRPAIYSPSDIRGEITLPEAGEPSPRATSTRKPVKGSFIPVEVTPQLRAAAEKIPGLTKFVGQKAVDVTPEGTVVNAPTPEVSHAVKPMEAATTNIPGLQERAKHLIYSAVEPEQIIAESKGEKDGSASHLKRALYSGMNWGALIRQSSLGKGIYTLFNNADNLAKKSLNEKILPIEKSLVMLNKNDQTVLWNTLMDEMFTGQRKSPTELEGIFASGKRPEKLAKAYRNLRRGLEETGVELNKGRQAAGLDPVELVDAYVSSQWRGNFKSAAYVPTGKFLPTGEPKMKLVGYLRSTSKRNLRAQKAALEKQFGSVVWKDAKPGDYSTPSDTLQASFLDAVKLLDQDDPLVQAFVKAQEDLMAREAQTSGGIHFHGEEKGNIRGFIGDRPDLTPEKNARQGLNSQIRYMKNVYKWSEQQQAVAKAKQVLTDPELTASQPNNVAYAKQYIKNSLGFGTQREIRLLEEKLSRGLGLDRQGVMDGLNMIRGFWYVKQLGLLNPKATAVQLTQPLYAIPTHMDLFDAGLKHDPIKTAAAQFKDMGHMWAGVFDDMTPQGRAAIQYAQERGILSINVLDDIRDVGDSLLKRKAMQVANLNQVKAEEFGRTFAYLGFIHHLHQAGLRGETLYRTAEAATNRTMVDYRKFEQPMWMEQGGLVGRSVGTLKNFVNNQANQLVYFSKQAAKGNVAPLASLLAIQYALAGNMGMVGMETVSQIWDNLIKPMLGPKFADKSLKLELLENFPDLFNYGLISKATGINMFGSLSQGQLGGFDDLPSWLAPFAEDIVKSGMSLGSAIIDPTNADKWRKALYNNLPPHLRGTMENLDPALTSPSGSTINPNNPNKGMYKRNEFDRTVRYFGATSFDEAVAKDKAYEASKREQAINEAKSQLRERFISASRNNDQQAKKEVIETLRQWMGPQEIAKYLVDALKNAAISRGQDVVTRQLPKQLNSVSSQKKYRRIREATQ